jgi:hypothetical protein
VTGPLAAVRDFFLAPPVHARSATARPAAAPPAFAVLGERRGAVAVASGLVLASGAGPGLVCVWPPGDTRPRVPGTGRARRLAARLRARGLTAAAGGRLVRAPLPAPAAEAVAAAQRAVAAAGVASAIALAGPREDDLDVLLSLQDAVLLVLRDAADSPLARLAVSGLADLGVSVVTVASPSGPARELAAGGLLALPTLRAGLEPALAAVGCV